MNADLRPLPIHRLRSLTTRLAVAAALLLSGALAGAGAGAQEPENTRAGIVIDFGDGVVETACVDLGADGQATGEEVLATAGFDVLIEYSPMGGAVCKIDNRGCNFPNQQCWCECLSSPCVYWAYNHLQGGQWVYSALGASVYTVRAGDVEGWAWGAGSLTQGTAPPLFTFEQVCAASLATATPTWTPQPTATWTPPPTNTPQPTATWTPWPTNTPQPTATWTPWPTDTPPVNAAWTPAPSDTPSPSATAAAALAVLASTPTETPSPPPSATPTATAQLVAAAPPAAPAAGSLFVPLVGHNAAAPPVAGAAAAAPPAATDAPAAPDALPPAEALPEAVAATPQADAVALAVAAPRPVIDPAQFPRAAANAGDSAPSAQALPDYTLLLLMTLAGATALTAGRALRRGRATVARRRTWPATAGWNRRALARQTARHGLSVLVYGLSTAIGVIALLYPFLATAVSSTTGQPSAPNGPGLMMVLLLFCFAGLLLEVQGQAVSSKLIALLGVLVAINSVLRFVEVGIPGPGGFSPVFVLIILTGYVYGGRFGFLMGALTLLVSAVFTGGVGPWLPGQMFAAGWVGLSAPLARPIVRLSGGQPGSRRELAVLTVFAGVWGLLFGAIMNLWFWPFMTGPANQYWQAGVSMAETLRRYLAYYLVTSLLWDSLRLAGNVALMLAFGGATLRALRRFGQRFSFEYQPQPLSLPPDAVAQRQPGFPAASPLPGSSQG